MNEELTREVLEAMKKCNHDCSTCSANKVCIKCDWKDVMQSLATALLEERDKPKVWDGAPDNAFRSIVNWYDKSRGFIKSKVLTRELPKTRIDEIIDESLDGWLFGMRVGKSEMREVLKSALNKYAEELEGKE